MNETCRHRGEMVREEWSGFSGRYEPVFACSIYSECVIRRINHKEYARCVGCRQFSPRTAEDAGPLKAELQAAAEELFCVHRQEIAYTMQAGSRPCVKRPVTVWKCALHGECSLRPESCLNGKVRGCSACSDLTPLVQINANENAD